MKLHCLSTSFSPPSWLTCFIFFLLCSLTWLWLKHAEPLPFWGAYWLAAFLLKRFWIPSGRWLASNAFQVQSHGQGIPRSFPKDRCVMRWAARKEGDCQTKGQHDVFFVLVHVSVLVGVLVCNFVLVVALVLVFVPVLFVDFVRVLVLVCDIAVVLVIVIVIALVCVIDVVSLVLVCFCLCLCSCCCFCNCSWSSFCSSCCSCSC